MANYNLVENTPQYDFHHSRAKLQIFGGGFANGKTTALAVKALKLARDYPGSNGLLARSTYPKLNDTLRKVVLQWCPEHWIKKRPTQEENSLYLTNGTVINFRYIAQRGKQSESRDTTSNLLSATYDWIGVDQTEDPEITQKDILDLFGRLRGDTPYRPTTGQDDDTMPDTGPRWIMLTLNPTRNWVYREFIQPFHQFQKRGEVSPKLLIDEETRLPIMELFEGSTYTNERNLKADYIKSLEITYKGQMRDRYLLGKWAAYEGLVYDTFDPDVHLLDRRFAEDYLHSCINRDVNVRPIECYDFGMTSPSCYMLGFIDDAGRVIMLDGFYRAGFPYFEQPRSIMEIRSKYPMDYTDHPILADPDCFRKKVVSGRSTGESVVQLLTSDNGLRFRAGSNDISAGIAKVQAYLTGHSAAPHLVTGMAPGPLLYFVSDMSYVEDEISAYYWKRNPMGVNIDEPIGNNDHAMDAIKYALSKRPMPSDIEVPASKLPPQWSYWHEVEDAHV